MREDENPLRERVLVLLHYFDGQKNNEIGWDNQSHFSCNSCRIVPRHDSSSSFFD